MANTEPYIVFEMTSSATTFPYQSGGNLVPSTTQPAYTAGTSSEQPHQWVPPNQVFNIGTTAHTAGIAVPSWRDPVHAVDATQAGPYMDINGKISVDGQVMTPIAHTSGPGTGLFVNDSVYTLTFSTTDGKITIDGVTYNAALFTLYPNWGGSAKTTNLIEFFDSAGNQHVFKIPRTTTPFTNPFHVSALGNVDGKVHSYLMFRSQADADAWQKNMDYVKSLTTNGNSVAGVHLQYAHQPSIDFTMSNFKPIIPKPCFTAGTEIACRFGLKNVEDIVIGDMVETLAHGIKEVKWVGKSTAFVSSLTAPIVFKAGSIGNTSDLTVSPQHQVLLSNWQAQVMFGVDEVLVPAKKLVNGDTIYVDNSMNTIDYYHFAFDQHEIVTANGALTESLFVGAEALKTMSTEQREELEAIFPELLINADTGEAAAYVATDAEAAILKAILAA